MTDPAPVAPLPPDQTLRQMLDLLRYGTRAELGAFRNVLAGEFWP